MNDYYTRWVSGVLFPLHERLKRHDSVPVRRQMEDSQWWPAERLAAYRLERLRALLTHAGQHTAYYRQLFQESGFAPKNFNALTELQQLPLLTKAMIRANTEALKSEHAHGLARFNTGGSSGEPLIFYIGRERVSHDVAAKWRATRWWDVDIGDPEIVVWGSPVELGAQDRLRAWRDRLFRTRLLPAFAMSPAKLDEFVAAIRAMRPKMLFGYPSALSLIARHARQQGQRMDDLGIRVAFVTAERLYDEQRQMIAETFSCRVANGYGSRDAGFIAHQCPAGGLHITAEDIIVEIVDSEGRVLPPGASGEIVVTHLATQDFPFIRYRTGDVGVLSEQRCRCGRTLPLLAEVQGRTTDFIVAPDGTIMHGLALIYVIRNLPGIAAFKIIQEDRQHIRVLLVPTAECAADIAATIVAGFRQRLGATVQVTVEQVAAILPEHSGKYRYVVSQVTV